MSNRDTVNKLLQDLANEGKAGAEKFAQGVVDATLDGATGLVLGGGEVAKKYARTSMDRARLAATELVTGIHKPEEWAFLESQHASQNLQATAMAEIHSMAYLANVVSLASGFLGPLAGKAGDAIVGTLTRMIKRA